MKCQSTRITISILCVSNLVQRSSASSYNSYGRGQGRNGGGDSWRYSESNEYSSSSNNNDYYGRGRDDRVSRRRMEEEADPIDFRFRSAPPVYSYNDDEDDDNNSEKNGEYSRGGPSNNAGGDGEGLSAKEQRDLLTRYLAAGKLNKLRVLLSTALIGYGFGSFVGKSVEFIPFSRQMLSSSFAIFAVMLNFLRTVYSELLQSLGLMLIMTASKLRSIRKEYPTWPHIKHMLRPSTCPRKPFPRGDEERDASLWQYKGDDFNMMYTSLAMGMAGVIAGGNLPLVPTFLGAPVGSAVFAYLCTLQDSSIGDLSRSMGMKVVAIFEEMMFAQSELRIVSKSMVVANRILDKLLILDRKHRIKDRVVSGIKWGYDKVTSTISEAQNGASQQDRERDGRGRNDSSRRSRSDQRDRNRFYDEGDESSRSYSGQRNNREYERNSDDSVGEYSSQNSAYARESEIRRNVPPPNGHPNDDDRNR